MSDTNQLEVNIPKQKKKKGPKKEEFDIKNYLDVYEFPVTLPGSKETITIKPITTGQLKKVLVYEDENDPYVIEEALDQLITDCVVDEDFDIDDLYLQDRFFLLLQIRNKTKGSSYSFTYKCDKCKNEHLKTVDLDKLVIKNRKESDNKIKISSKMSVELDFPTRGEQKDVYSFVKEETGISDYKRLAELSSYTFATAIKKFITNNKVIEDPSLEDRIYIVENLPEFIFDDVKKWFVDNEFGVDFKINLECPSCKNKREVEIPVENFFV
jgi:hypothetical protein